MAYTGRATQSKVTFVPMCETGFPLLVRCWDESRREIVSSIGPTERIWASNVDVTHTK